MARPSSGRLGPRLTPNSQPDLFFFFFGFEFHMGFGRVGSGSFTMIFKPGFGEFTASLSNFCLTVEKI